MKYFLLSVAVIFSAAFTTVNAQSKDAEKYRKESEEMRKAVWAWEKPQFKVKDIPQQYAGASKLLLHTIPNLQPTVNLNLHFTALALAPKKSRHLPKW